ncbi:hypothetical protein K1T71_008530 [Dendrolimus kikuchii]|uniref:Uncharacterized protein n=1 Tax=Dendrolimus kikuchii TaxID=765133 RepID=A0ACC1CUX9_9NEOP|nr:hypothetical protein K1T71_008530 [Dendrolimus kikuchii]
MEADRRSVVGNGRWQQAQGRGGATRRVCRASCAAWRGGSVDATRDTRPPLACQPHVALLQVQEQLTADAAPAAPPLAPGDELASICGAISHGNKASSFQYGQLFTPNNNWEAKAVRRDSYTETYLSRSGSGAAAASASASAAGTAARGMECGVAAGGYAPARPPHPAHPALSPTERSPAKSGLHVNFSDKGEVKERREKFLTAKYGSHQMALIRKRLAVEMWLYDELQKLYEAPKDAVGGAAAAAASQEVEVDIDELLDMDDEQRRRAHLATLLADAKKPQKDVHKFINELLEKAKTL